MAGRVDTVPRDPGHPKERHAKADHVLEGSVCVCVHTGVYACTCVIQQGEPGALLTSTVMMKVGGDRAGAPTTCARSSSSIGSDLSSRSPTTEPASY